MIRHFRTVLWFCLAGILIQGCGDSTDKYSAPGNVCSFQIPAGWELVEEIERGGVITLVLQELERGSSFVTIMVMPADDFDHERALEEAEKQLLKGLFAPQEPVRTEIILISGESIPVVRIQAGERETVEALAVVVYGKHYFATASAISRLEHARSDLEEFRQLLDTIEVK